jgi:hypothetical protein
MWDFINNVIRSEVCRSQWPRGLRRRPSAARLLRLWVRIPPSAWMFVCCECCVLSSRGLCDRLITRPEESYRLWRVVVWSRNLENEEAKARHWAVKIQPQWVVTPGKQRNTQTTFRSCINVERKSGEAESFGAWAKYRLNDSYSAMLCIVSQNIFI